MTRINNNNDMIDINNAIDNMFNDDTFVIIDVSTSFAHDDDTRNNDDELTLCDMLISTM